MKIRSFRVRIAIWSVICSSLVLLGSALVVGNMMWSTEVRRADQFLGIVVRDNIENGFHPPRGQRPPGDPPPESFFKGPPPFGRRPQWDRPFSTRQAEPFRDEPRALRGRSPHMRRDMALFEDRNTSEPAVFYQFKELANHAEYHSTNWPAALSGRNLADSPDGVVRIRTTYLNGTLWRVGAGANAERSMIFALDLEPVVTMIRHAASAMLLSIPVALMLIALGAVFMASRALRPVHELTSLVERITARGLSERVESRVRDEEFEKLIQVFNEMMDRLERSFLQANRFSADAAHELRTPITVLQGHVERMLQGSAPGSQMQQDLGDMVDELHRIKSILEKLLLLARMDAGQLHVHTEPLDLSELVASIAEDLQAIAPAIEVEASLEPSVHVSANASLLETAIQNLGGNAVKYNLESNGWIRIELLRRDGSALLAISNTGPKISPEEREKIFERFYRADKSRSRETDGLGLGLSLAREIAQAHHGALRLIENGGVVNRFELTLPLHHLEPPTPAPAA